MVSPAIAAALLFVFLIPVTAGMPVMRGTEEEPELSDPAGNVEYSSLYTGQRNRDHVDLLAGWFEYDATNDTLGFTMKLGSLEQVNQSTEGGWDVRYDFRGDLSVEDKVTKELSYRVGRSSQTGEWSPGVFLESAGGQHVDVPFTFAREDAAPGYFRWYVPLDYLRNHGEQVATFRAVATEELFVGQSFVSTNVFNSNSATAAGSFSWKDLRRVGNNGSEEEFPTTGTAGTTTTSTESGTASLGIVASGAALVILAVAVRRRRS